jgi:hypothetical protein
VVVSSKIIDESGQTIPIKHFKGDLITLNQLEVVRPFHQAQPQLAEEEGKRDF